MEFAILVYLIIGMLWVIVADPTDPIANWPIALFVVLFWPIVATAVLFMWFIGRQDRS